MAMDVADSLLDLVGNTPLVRLGRVGARPRVRPRRQGRAVQPGRQRQGPARDRDDRRGRARRPAAPGRHDRRTDVGQHRRGARHRRRPARLPLHLRDVRQDERRRRSRCCARTAPTSSCARPRCRPSTPTPTTRSPTASPARRPARSAPTSTRTLPTPPSTSAPPDPRSGARPTGRITHFVAGIGTGGTITGVARYLKAQNPEVQIVGADPEGSVYSGGTGPPVPRRGRGRGLLAHDLRPVARRPRGAGHRRRVASPRRAASRARRACSSAGRAARRSHAALVVGARARSGGGRRRAAPRLRPQLPLEDLRRRVDDRASASCAARVPTAGDVLAAKDGSIPDLVVITADTPTRDAFARDARARRVAARRRHHHRPAAWPPRRCRARCPSCR